eukprot:TRINITY_DN10585_c1_g1_i1.p2 TRINITY_DN10585_c1_g1~~TRINITY_DN10585_c1_g1_i1.p2  ORF type:complete len:239 (-),score=64.45 TRINITY_DN10585_c1_g1_i1:14-730(-)
MDELSNLSAQSGDILSKVSDTYDDIRKRLVKLAGLMTQYNLQMSSDECGGPSEYVEFFYSLKKIHNIQQKRQELREEIQEVLALVENGYAEERRRLEAENQKVSELEIKKERTKEKRRLRDKARFDVLFAMVSSIGIPILAITSVFSMNIDDLPRSVPFWLAIPCTIGVCLLIILALLILAGGRQSSEEKYINKYYTLQQSTIGNIDLDKMKQNNHLIHQTFLPPLVSTQHNPVITNL